MAKQTIKQTMVRIYNSVVDYFNPRFIDVQKTRQFLKRGITPFYSFDLNKERVENE